MVDIRSITVALLTVFWLSGVAAAASSSDEIGGRWRSVADQTQDVMVLDISRCGGGWCGMTVTAAGRCESTVLRVDANLNGRLELTPQANWFGVRVFVDRGGEKLHVLGQSGHEYFIGARTLGYERSFARSGVATCVAKTVS